MPYWVALMCLLTQHLVVRSHGNYLALASSNEADPLMPGIRHSCLWSLDISVASRLCVVACMHAAQRSPEYHKHHGCVLPADEMALGFAKMQLERRDGRMRVWIKLMAMGRSCQSAGIWLTEPVEHDDLACGCSDEAKIGSFGVGTVWPAGHAYGARVVGRDRVDSCTQDHHLISGTSPWEPPAIHPANLQDDSTDE